MSGPGIRRRLALLAPAGILALGLAGAGAWLTFARPDPSGVAAIGGPFQLQAADGRTVTDKDYRGKWMLVYFGYTNCPDACPTALQTVANALDTLGTDAKARVAVLFVTVDPERDTPQVLADYVSAFDAPITGLGGSPEQVAAAARVYRVYYTKHAKAGGYDMDHSSVIYVMDPNGRFAGNFTHQTSPDAMAARLRALMDGKERVSQASTGP